MMKLKMFANFLKPQYKPVEKGHNWYIWKTFNLYIIVVNINRTFLSVDKFLSEKLYCYNETFRARERILKCN